MLALWPCAVSVSMTSLKKKKKPPKALDMSRAADDVLPAAGARPLAAAGRRCYAVAFCLSRSGLVGRVVYPPFWRHQ